MMRNRGYTLVELLVVAVLAVGLLGIAAAGYRTWIRTTAADASTTRFLAELERARAYALARCCATRITFFDDARGDLVVIDRLDSEKGEEWYPISRTNRLERTHVEPYRSVFFRADGSCCTEENGLAAEADFTEYEMELQCRAAKSGTAASKQQETREIFINARTGLANIFTSEVKTEANQ